MIISDMKRLPASGIAIVTGPASRSNTADEYSVSRLRRMTVWLSIVRVRADGELSEGAASLTIRRNTDRIRRG